MLSGRLLTYAYYSRVGSICDALDLRPILSSRVLGCFRWHCTDRASEGELVHPLKKVITLFWWSLRSSYDRPWYACRSLLMYLLSVCHIYCDTTVCEKALERQRVAMRAIRVFFCTGTQVLKINGEKTSWRKWLSLEATFMVCLGRGRTASP